MTKQIWLFSATLASNYFYLATTVKPLLSGLLLSGTSLNWAADSLHFMLTLQKLWAVQWVWPIIAYVFILYSEIRTNLSYGHPLIPRRPDKRGLTVAAPLPLGVIFLWRLNSRVYGTKKACFFSFMIKKMQKIFLRLCDLHKKITNILVL